MVESPKLKELALSALWKYRKLEDCDNIMINHNKDVSSLVIEDAALRFSVVEEEIKGILYQFNKESVRTGIRATKYEDFFTVCNQYANQ